MKNVKTIGLGFLMMLGLSLVSAQCGSDPEIGGGGIEDPQDTTQVDVPTTNTDDTDTNSTIDEPNTTEVEVEVEAEEEVEL